MYDKVGPNWGHWVPLLMPQKVLLLFGVAEQAFELLVHVSSHAASSGETKQRAERLRAQLEPQLTSQQIGVIEAQAPTKAFDAVVKELFEHLPDEPARSP